MNNYDMEYQTEKEYLEKSLRVIKYEMDKELGILSDRKHELLEARREMWESTVHYSDDFEKMMEISQYLSLIGSQTGSYRGTIRQIEKYKRMIFSPYFGRFDFVEDGSEETEKIYVGLNNVTDSRTLDIVVYDWRAPISSIYYQYELGRVFYKAPKSIIEGSVNLKRQYNIKNSNLEYYFDCNVKIDDELLQKVLCRNASPKMRNIVESIQKEQDVIIRDTDNELLMVQGVAGSGKTSIALHRIAYLLYYGMDSQVQSNNILIISPNSVFGSYISTVLPDLGEENVDQLTFDELSLKLLGTAVTIEKRSEQLEALITEQCQQKPKLRKSSIEFKESEAFAVILKRLLSYYEKHMVEFEDVYYDGKLIETRQQLKNMFYNDKLERPMIQRLKRIERILFNSIHPYQRPRVKKIEKLVQTLEGHEFDVKPFSRLMSIKESKRLYDKIRKFTEIDYFEVYKKLFTIDGLLEKLAVDLDLPENIKDISEFTRDSLRQGYVYYEDCAPLIFLKLKLEGSTEYLNIRQVVVDEAQDYTPLQYEIFGILFRYAGFTVLGDIQQAIDKEVELSLYDKIDKILNKRSSVQLYLDKSYRSSYEISMFTQKLLKPKQACISFERYEEKPQIIQSSNEPKMLQAVIDSTKELASEGYKSIAVICKSMQEASEVYQQLEKSIEVKLVSGEEEIQKGVLVMPAYISKGLEFDAVLVYDVSRENYNSELDRKLLYVACTRALHRLRLFYAGDVSEMV